MQGIIAVVRVSRQNRYVDVRSACAHVTFLVGRHVAGRRTWCPVSMGIHTDTSSTLHAWVSPLTIVSAITGFVRVCCSRRPARIRDDDAPS